MTKSVGHRGYTRFISHKVPITPDENGNRAERRAAKKLKKKKGK